MRVYLGLKYHPDGRNRRRVDRMDRMLETLGWRSFFVERDVERWGEVTLSPAALMRGSFRAIDASDAVVLDMSEKGVGLGIEAGYAYARGKSIIVIAADGTDISTTLSGIAQRVCFYGDLEDLATIFAFALPKALP